MPRQARLDSPGTLHHIIIRGIERRRIVDDRKDRDTFISRLGAVATATTTPIYAWALMSNHAHFLLRSGPEGISKFMRRFLTRYAVYYNRRHDRHGHLFQNRYKSIVCDEDNYFAELVRYIHLNPLRAGAVKSLSNLDSYKYSGHSIIMGKTMHDWQYRDYVLNWFGDKERSAVKAYRRFVQVGIDEGKRPELVGGGLIRSLGGWAEVISMRRRGDRELIDERILGRGEFVEKILAEAEEKTTHDFSVEERKKKIKEVMGELCREKGVNIKEVRSGGRRAVVSRVRAKIVEKLIKGYGISMSEVARNVGVTTSGIFRILKRNEN